MPEWHECDSRLWRESSRSEVRLHKGSKVVFLFFFLTYFVCGNRSYCRKQARFLQGCGSPCLTGAALRAYQRLLTLPPHPLSLCHLPKLPCLFTILIGSEPRFLKKSQLVHHMQCDLEEIVLINQIFMRTHRNSYSVVIRIAELSVAFCETLHPDPETASKRNPYNHKQSIIPTQRP